MDHVAIATRPTPKDLIESHFHWAGAVAARAVQGCPFEVRADLFSAGLVGLVEAAHRFNPDGNVPFSAYALPRIRGAVLDAQRTSDPLTRADRKKVREGKAFDPGITRSVEAIQERGIDSFRQLVDPTHREGTTDPRWLLVAKRIKRLPAKERRALILIYGHGLTLAEVGRQLLMSESGVCRLRERAISKIRQALDGQV